MRHVRVRGARISGGNVRLPHELARSRQNHNLSQYVTIYHNQNISSIDLLYPPPVVRSSLPKSLMHSHSRRRRPLATAPARCPSDLSVRAGIAARSDRGAVPLES